MYKRSIQNQVIETLDNHKIAILCGARQVGKTTLTTEIADYFKKKRGYTDLDILQVNGDYLSVQKSLSMQELKPLLAFVGNAKLLIIDEAQRISNIGINLKIIYDALPDIQIIATGSSSFELSNQINEPLTGRNHKFIMTPLSYQELTQKERVYDLNHNLDNLLIYGSYPQVYLSNNIENKRTNLQDLTTDYLFKDVLSFENIKKPELLTKILEYLALNIGSTISYNNIANTLETNPRTVARYIDLLEQTFVIFRLGAFSRNLNNELIKSFKIYFWDLGIRNSLLERFNQLSLRNDIGALWENFCVSERMKYNYNNQKYGKYFFWRAANHNEVDFIEDVDGVLAGYEFKYNKSKMAKGSYNFQNEYPGSSLTLINKDNFEGFVLPRKV